MKVAVFSSVSSANPFDFTLVHTEKLCCFLVLQAVLYNDDDDDVGRVESD